MGKYLDKYIKKHSLSVGYNTNLGQEFFDMLSAYEDYIYDFFFGISESIGGYTLNPEAEIEKISKLDTYNLPADLIFNNYASMIRTIDYVPELMKILNVKAITILDPYRAKHLKEKYPGVEIHLSTRFWDWGRFPNPIARVKELAQNGIDVINISAAYSLTDFNIIDEIHSYGMKVKIIVNEGCIMRKDFNYSQFPGFEDTMCRTNPFFPSACFSQCVPFLESYQWMELSRINLFKEFLPYYENHPVDIWKISGRHRTMDRMIKALTYWTSDEDTKIYRPSLYAPFDISDKYDIFLEYIDDRVHCKGDCWNCKKCKKYWELLAPESIRKESKGDGTIQETAEQRARREMH